MKSPTIKSKTRQKPRKTVRKSFSEFSLILDEGAVARCFIESSRILEVEFSNNTEKKQSNTNHLCRIAFKEKFTDTPLRDAYIAALTATIERVFDTKTSRGIYPVDGHDDLTELRLFYNIRKAKNFSETKYDEGILVTKKNG